MKKRLISFLLIFSILFSSFSISVYAEDNPNWISVDEELINELYYLFSCAGVVFSPDISLYDVLSTLSTSPTAGMFRINPDTLSLEIDSSFRYDYGDKVTYPAETANIIKSMLSEYPQKISKTSAYLEYTPVEQNGQIFTPKGSIYKGFINPTWYPNSEYTYILNNSSTAGIKTLDTSRYKLFGVLSSDDYGKKITFYELRLSDNYLSTFQIPHTELRHDVVNLTTSKTVTTGSFFHQSVISYNLNFPLFSSTDEGIKWAVGTNVLPINNTYNTNYYLSQKFNQSVDNSVIITNEMLTQNYQEINNNYYNNVYNYVSNYVTENDSNPDTSALQSKIDEMQSSLDELLEEIKNSSGGGSGDSGGGTGSDSSIDYSKDFEEINASLSDIYKKLEEFYNKYKDTVDSQTEIDLSNIEKSLSDLDKLLTDFSANNLQALDDMYKRLDDILTELKNHPDPEDYTTNFENLEQILADIQLLLTSDSELYHSSLFHIEELFDENNKQNKKFFDKVLEKLDEIIKYLKKIYRVNVVDTIADIVTAISETLEDVANVNNISVRSKETVNLMKKKFPFCMPFDLYTTLFALYAPPEVPHFEIPFVFDFLGTHTENSIEIDFEQFEGLVSFSRDLTTILFVLSLIMLTMKFFKGDDEK